jgi:hypothetical protein
VDLKREIKISDVRPQVRIVVIVGLAVAAVGAMLLLFTRSHSSSGTASPVVPTVATTTPATPARPARTHTARRVVTPAPQGPPKLPQSIVQGLGSGRVVVVSLYAPGVTLDKLATLEAKAGAADVGAAFAAVDVTKSGVDALAARYSVLHDPTVLVLSPPEGDLLVKIDGFADENTVAQAAAPVGQQ